MIDRGSVQPPYEQIARMIRERIESGELAPGQKLPPILELAGTYQVATITVRKALDVLKRADLVVSRAGWGVFVAEVKT